MTCRDLITEALNEIRVYSSGETPSGDDSALGLVRLQDISDTYLGTASTTLTLDGDLPALDREGLMYELAYRLCGPFGATLTDFQRDLHRRSRTRLFAATHTPTVVELDPGYVHLTFYANHYLDVLDEE